MGFFPLQATGERQEIPCAASVAVETGNWGVGAGGRCSDFGCTGNLLNNTLKGQPGYKICFNYIIFPFRQTILTTLFCRNIVLFNPNCHFTFKICCGFATTYTHTVIHSPLTNHSFVSFGFYRNSFETNFLGQRVGRSHTNPIPTDFWG